MKFKIKKFKVIFIYIIIPVILIVFLGIALYQSDRRMKLLKQGIDLKPRPFSELIATDFASVKDEPADPSKCDGTKILKFLEGVKDSKAPVDWFKNYDPNIHKLTILDNCWRQYENEYVKFKFRDLNGSLKMSGVDSFSIEDFGSDKSNNFGIAVIKRNNPSIQEDIINRLKSELATVKNIKIYKNSRGAEIYRADTIHLTYKYENKSYYFIDLPDYNKFIFIMSYSEPTMKDILSTIEVKK